MSAIWPTAHTSSEAIAATPYRVSVPGVGLGLSTTCQSPVQVGVAVGVLLGVSVLLGVWVGVH